MKTIKFHNVYINANYTLLGRNEHSPVIENKVDKNLNDYYNKEKAVELGEISYQKESIKGILHKIKKHENDIDLLIGGDLQNQILATNFSAKDFNISHLGIYSACATFAEGLIIGAGFIESGLVKNAIITTSSHNLVSEKQFRFPIEYGAIRKKINTFTATGSVSAYLYKEGKIKIESATIGKVIDMKYDDPNNMGACMAPSAAEIIYEHLKSTGRKPDYYDIILTGDLGKCGILIVKEYLKRKYNLKIENIEDSGVLLFDAKNNPKIAGGSGPICLPLILFAKISKIKYRKILIIATGSLHSALSSNLKLSVPSISHAISLEVI